MIVAFSALFGGYVACDDDNPGLSAPGTGQDSVGTPGGGGIDSTGDGGGTEGGTDGVTGTGTGSGGTGGGIIHTLL